MGGRVDSKGDIMSKILEAIELVRMYHNHRLNEATDTELRDHKPDFEWTLDELERIATEEYNKPLDEKIEKLRNRIMM